MDLYPKYEKCKVSLNWALISNFPSLLVAVPITLLRVTILTFYKVRFVLEFKIVPLTLVISWAKKEIEIKKKKINVIDLFIL